jgi:DeoR/GlpR family transcriptional regulator of sugar metabolism
VRFHAILCYNCIMATDHHAALPQPEAGRRLPAGRKAALLKSVSTAGQVTVAELAEEFSVSPDTIRRDLDRLDADGLVIRTHGGAVSPHALPKPDTGLDVRKRVQIEAKEAIGAIAASLVHDGDTIMINGGTTPLALARHLRHHSELTIATNNLLLASELDESVYNNLYVFGGTVRPSAQATVGPVHFGGLANGDVAVRCRLSLIAVGGLTADGGYSTSNIAEATMMRDMMDSADKVAILVDSTKFGRKLFAQFAPLKAADYVITERLPSPDFVRALSDAGVELLHP